MKNRKNTAFLIVNMLFPLLAGAVIYCIFSPDVYCVKLVDELLGIRIHMNTDYISTEVVQIVRNYLPDLLWGYSLVFVLFAVWERNAEDVVKILVIAIVFSVVMECIQRLSFIQGTFDILDIVVESLAETTAAVIICLFFRR